MLELERESATLAVDAGGAPLARPIRVLWFGGSAGSRRPWWELGRGRRCLLPRSGGSGAGLNLRCWRRDPAQLDLHCPLLSLPLAFGTRLETIPAAVPYIAQNRAGVSKWRKKLSVPKTQLVGLCWKGDPIYKRDRDRSIRLRTIGADRDCRSLANAERQDIEDALGVTSHAVLHDLDARVLKTGRRLHEERGRPGMQPNLVHDGELTFGYDVYRLPLSRSLQPRPHSVKVT